MEVVVFVFMSGFAGEGRLGHDTAGDVSRALYDRYVAGSEHCAEASINCMVRVRPMMHPNYDALFALIRSL